MVQFYNPFPFVDGRLCYMYLGVGNLTNTTLNIKKWKKLHFSWKLQYLNQVTLLLFPTYPYKRPIVSYSIPLGTADVLYLKCNRSSLSLTKLPKYHFSKQLQFRRGTTKNICSSSERKQYFAFLFIVKPSDKSNYKIIFVRLYFLAYKFFMKRSEILSENCSKYSNLLFIISLSITSNM
jgi:hypothetical protein